MNKLNYDKKTVSFNSIPSGGMFRYKQKVYMKIQSWFRMVEENCSYNLMYETKEEYYDVIGLAVNLSNGEIDNFKWNTEVDVMRIDKIEIEIEVE